jgi:SnoaL-like domain
VGGADLVREVFARVGNGDLSVADLYTEDAIILYGPDGAAEGREQIRAFYARTIEAISPKPQVETILEDPPRFVALVNVPTATGHHRAVDLFEVAEDGIRRLEIFSRR